MHPRWARFWLPVNLASVWSLTPSPTEPNLWPGKSEYAVLFHERATAGFKHLDDAFPYMKLDFPPRSLGRIWALANSHSLLRDPAPILTSYLPFFTIESVPSCQQRRKWADKAASDWFYMKTWSSSEVLHRKRIASRWIFELISDLHGKNRVSEMRDFYNLFQQSMVAATTSGWAFELWIHRLLREENLIQLFPIHCRATEGNFIRDDYTVSWEGPKDRGFLQMTGSEEHPLAELVSSKSATTTASRPLTLIQLAPRWCTLLMNPHLFS